MSDLPQDRVAVVARVFDVPEQVVVAGFTCPATLEAVAELDDARCYLCGLDPSWHRTEQEAEADRGAS